MVEHRPHYRTFVVHAWREASESAGDEVWRLTLEVPALGVRKGFSNFQELAETMRLHLTVTELDHPATSDDPDA